MIAKDVKTNIIKEYATHEGDTGSPEVQVAVLTHRINELNEHLKKNPKVKSVSHPSLPDSPTHALYEKYFPNGAGCIFTFDVNGTKEQTQKLTESLKIFSLLANVADEKSLIIHPASTTHSQLTEEELASVHISPQTVRISVGAENIRDLIADLEQAFAQI